MQIVWLKLQVWMMINYLNIYRLPMFYLTGAQNAGKTVTLLVRGSNKLVLEEADRSIHDALCVVRCLVRNKALVAGGGAPEIELALKLAAIADTLEGLDAICLKAYANALEIVPFTLAENAGLNAIQVCCLLLVNYF